MRSGVTQIIVPLAAILLALPQEKERLDARGDPLPAGALARMGSARFRHGAAIHRADFTADGKRIVSGGVDGHVRVWDAATGREVRSFDMEESVAALAVCPGGNLVTAVASGYPFGRISFHGPDRGSVHVWDLESGERRSRLAATFTGEGALAISPDGKILAVTSGGSRGGWMRAPGEERTLEIWDLEKDVCLGALPDSPTAGAAAVFSPDSKLLAVGSQDGEIGIWEMASKDRITSIEPGGSAGDLAFSADGEVLAAACGPAGIFLWEMPGGKAIRRIEAEGDGFISVDISPDGKLLAGRGPDGRIHLWEAETGKALREIGDGFRRTQVPPWFPAPEVGSVRFSPDGRALVAAGPGSMVRLWDPATGKPISDPEGHTRHVSSVAFSPDGKVLATAGGDGAVQLWDAGDGKPVQTVRRDDAPALALAFSPDGRRLAVGSEDGSVHLVSIRDGRTGASEDLPWGAVGVQGLAFSGDGRCLIAAGVRGEAHRIDLESGEWRSTGEELPDGDSIIAITHGGDRIPLMLTLWFTAKPWEAVAAGTPGVPWVAYRSGDGKVRVLREGEGAGSFEIETMKVSQGAHRGGLWIAGLAMDPTLLALTPDGMILVGGNRSGVVETFEIASGKRILTWEAHDHEITALAVLPRLVATAGAGDTIVLWDATRGTRIRTLEGDQGGVMSLAFSPDGRRLASAGLDGTVLLWDVATVRHGVKSWREEIPRDKLETLWSALEGEDAGDAWKAIRILAAAPEVSVPFIAGRLFPEGDDGPDGVKALIAELDDPEFSKREEASAALRDLGPSVEPALRRALEGEVSPEVRWRAQAILETFGPPFEEFPSPAARRLRVLQVLEGAGTAEAVKVLDRIRDGSPSLLERDLAREAITRLRRRPREF